MIIDTHVHYNLSPLLDDWEAHWQSAKNNGVIQSIVVGTSITTSKTALEIAASTSELFAAIGIHPGTWEEDGIASPELVSKTCQQLKPLVHTNKVVAIGETGLDYFRSDKSTPHFNINRENQLQSLRAHLDLAVEQKLPVILHVRDHEVPEEKTPHNAYWDIAEIISEYKQQHPQLQTILHCVSGPLAYIQTMIALDSYISVAANCTYPSATAIRQIALLAPKDKLLIETDAPFLPPQPFRGKLCEPWMISKTADYLCELTHLSPLHLLQNTQKLFPRLAQSAIQ